MSSGYEELRGIVKELLGGEDTGRVFDILTETGDRILEALNPPPGLRAWLYARGMSLIPTRDPEEASRGSWEDMEEEAKTEVNWHQALEIGDRVKYVTSPGKTGLTHSGSGFISSHEHEDGVCQFSVDVGGSSEERLVFPQLGDLVEKY